MGGSQPHAGHLIFPPCYPTHSVMGHPAFRVSAMLYVCFHSQVSAGTVGKRVVGDVCAARTVCTYECYGESAFSKSSQLQNCLLA